ANRIPTVSAIITPGERQEYCMPHPKFVVAAVGLAVALGSAAPVAQKKASPLPRTPDGHPDLQGIWDFRSATPLERPARFGGREFMTPEEVVEYEKLALAREDGRPPDAARSPEGE